MTTAFVKRLVLLHPWFLARHGYSPAEARDLPVRPPEIWGLAASRTEDAGLSVDNYIWFVSEVLAISPGNDPEKDPVKGPRNLREPYVRQADCLRKMEHWARACRDTASWSLDTSRSVLEKLKAGGMGPAQAVLDVGLADPVFSADILAREGDQSVDGRRRIRMARMLLHFRPGYDARDFPDLSRVPLNLPEER